MAWMLGLARVDASPRSPVGGGRADLDVGVLDGAQPSPSCCVTTTTDDLEVAKPEWRPITGWTRA